jgi:hypothetical protein
MNPLTDEERIWRDQMPRPGYLLSNAEYLEKLDAALERARTGAHLLPMPCKDDIN